MMSNATQPHLTGIESLFTFLLMPMFQKKSNEVVQPTQPAQQDAGRKTSIFSKRTSTSTSVISNDSHKPASHRGNGPLSRSKDPSIAAAREKVKMADEVRC
jgi:hypothetical protein